MGLKKIKHALPGEKRLSIYGTDSGIGKVSFEFDLEIIVGIFRT